MVQSVLVVVGLTTERSNKESNKGNHTSVGTFFPVLVRVMRLCKCCAV